MKKPEIKYDSGTYDYNSDTILVRKPNGERKHLRGISEAYEDMIDALIEARGLAKVHISHFPDSKPTKSIFDKIEQALKKAGCHETDKI